MAVMPLAILLVPALLYGGWTTPKSISVNGPYCDVGPGISCDGRYLVFTSARPGGYGGFDLWAAELQGTQWSTPVNLGSAVNTAWNELAPHFSADGNTLYFTSDREGPFFDEDLWVSCREGDGWTEPVSMGSPPNSSYNERDPGIWPWGIELYFTSDDLPGGPGGYDIWTARRDGAGWTIPIPVPGLNGPHLDGRTAHSLDGKRIFFVSNRPGSAGNTDIWMARRDGEEWETPANVRALNHEGCDACPSLSGDGHTLYFCSDRPGGQGHHDIWTATWQSMNVRIKVKPESPMVVIPASGDSFAYALTLQNVTPELQRVSYWVELAEPDGSFSVPAYGPETIVLGSREILHSKRWHSVPESASAGTYTFNAYVGRYRSETYDFFSFPYFKLPRED